MELYQKAGIKRMQDFKILGFQNLDEMKSMQAKGFKTRKDYEIATALKLGFSDIDEMREILKEGFPNKAAWNERYIKFGFISMQDMKDYNARGYKTMDQFMSSTKLDANLFYDICKQASLERYNALCKGRKISWFGEIIIAQSGFGSNIKVLNEDGSELINGFTIDSKSMSEKISKADEGKRIFFEGVVENKNSISPDIESISSLKFETEDKRYSRLQKIKEEEEQKILLKEKEISQEINAHATDAKWLDEKYGLRAASRCSSGADDFLRNASKYSFKWDDEGWLSMKFTNYYSKMQIPGVITYTSNKVSLQNGFGAFQRIELACVFDIRKMKVVEYYIN
jgi:hypothetical protein